MVLHIEKAVPVGLIANELILNSLKHALKTGTGDLKLTLNVTRQDDGSGWAKVCVEDSGPGLPVEFDLSRPTSMGYQLINLLVRQLRARIEVGSGSGASITITFPISPR